MFEFQTAMSELTGLPVSNAGALRGADLGRLGRLPGDGRDQARASSSSPAASTRTAARRSRTYSVGYGAEVVEVGLEGGVTDAAALAAAVDGETAAVILQSPNFLGAVEDVEALGAAAKEHGALLVVACDPMTLGILKPPGECRRRHRPRRGPAARQPPRLRRPVVRLLLRDRGADPPDAGTDRRRNRGRRRAPRLRARAADPRAAHPPRESDQQHLHRAGAERARRDGPPGLARPRGLPRAGRAAGAAHRLRARAARRGRRGRAAARGAGRPRVRRAPRRAGRRGARPGRGARHRRRLPARPRVPGVRGRAARRDHRAPHARSRSTTSPRRSAPRSPPSVARTLSDSASTRHRRVREACRSHDAARRGADADANARRRSTRSRRPGGAPPCCPTPASRRRRSRT